MLTAIDNSEWEAARLGIEAMPNGPLKPYARAELYTAKDSPKVELEPILALLAEAPELPQAEQLLPHGDGAAAGAAEPPAIFWPRPTVSLGSAPRRGKTRPVEGEPAADQLRLAIEPFVKVDDGAERGGAVPGRTADPVVRSPGRGRPSRRLDVFRQRPRRRCPPRRRLRPARRDRRMGGAGGLDLRPGLLADERLERGLCRVPRGGVAAPASRNSMPPPIIGPPAPPRPAAGRRRSTRCSAPRPARRRAFTA